MKTEQNCGNCAFEVKVNYNLGHGNVHVEVDCNSEVNRRVIRDPINCRYWRIKDQVAEVQPKGINVQRNLR